MVTSEIKITAIMRYWVLIARSALMFQAPSAQDNNHRWHISGMSVQIGHQN